MADLWNIETPISDCAPDVGVPSWIESDISPSDIAAILQGGCASGAYMPSVTYHKALATMAEHGDDVLDYIENALGELPKPPDSASWSGMACHYLSCAVELWASSVEAEVEAALDAADDAAAQAKADRGAAEQSAWYDTSAELR
jgi:hypothetical protein